MLEQTRKECYFISGILGKEGQREGSWAVSGWRERMIMSVMAEKQKGGEEINMNDESALP